MLPRVVAAQVVVARKWRRQRDSAQVARTDGANRELPPTVVGMKRTRQLSPPLVRRAELQAGVFTKRQANDAHTPDSALTHVVAEGTCHRVLPGLYSLSPTLTVRARIWTGLLLGGPDAALGGAAARFVLGHGPVPDMIDVWTGHRSRSDRGCWRFHTGSPPADPEAEVDELIPVVSGLLTTRDLTRATVSAHCERQLHGSARERILALSEFEADVGCSVLESRWHSGVSLPHGLPPLTWSGFDAQRSAIVGSHEDTGVELEIGLFNRGHPDRRSWDTWGTPWFHRRFATRIGGQPTLDVDWDDVVHQPCEVAAELWMLLLQAGFRCEPQTCGGCARTTYERSWNDVPPTTSCPACGSRLTALLTHSA